jgi:hypothetical protein
MIAQCLIILEQFESLKANIFVAFGPFQSYFFLERLLTICFIEFAQHCKFIQNNLKSIQAALVTCGFDYLRVCPFNGNMDNKMPKQLSLVIHVLVFARYIEK